MVDFWDACGETGRFAGLDLDLLDQGPDEPPVRGADHDEALGHTEHVTDLQHDDVGTVLVVRDGKLLTGDVMLDKNDEIKLVAVISGG